MVLVDVELLEDLLQALLCQELFLVHANHHEFVEGDETVARAICHCDHVVNSLLVEICPEVLPVAVDELDSGECAIATSVKVGEDLLQFNRVIHVQEVLDQVAQCSLLGRIFGGERAQIGESPSYVLASLMHGSTVVILFHSSRQVKPGVLEGLGS